MERKGNKLELKMGLKSNLIFSNKKNREIDAAKKNKLREKFKHKFTSLTKKGCSKHPKKGEQRC